MRSIDVLTEATLASGVAELCARDRDLARVVARFGPPPLWAREPGFGTLVQIILEQQVSLASARAAYARLEARAGAASPAGLLALDDATLRALGFSRQKGGYVRALARAIADGSFAPDELAGLDDDAARARLVGLKGIGRWSADIYLLMALCRPDVWPHGDLALVGALREVKRLRTMPGPERVARITHRWRPWRAVAARILWHHYLSTPRARRRADKNEGGSTSVAPPSDSRRAGRVPARSARASARVSPRTARRTSRPAR